MSQNRKLTNWLPVLLMVSFLCAFPFMDASARDLSAKPGISESLSNITPAQEKWLKSTHYEKNLLIEEIGEQGARKFAKQNGYRAIFDGTQGKGIPQGLDQVYFNKKGGITVIEAKGGGSPLNNGYGYRQGSIEHTLRSAERMLKSSKASAEQKYAARRVLEYASKGKLTVKVVRTQHVLGKAVDTVVQKVVTSGPEHQKLAREIIKNFPNVFFNVSKVANKTTEKNAADGSKTESSKPTQSKAKPKASAAPKTKPVSSGSSEAQRASKPSKTTQPTPPKEHKNPSIPNGVKVTKSKSAPKATRTTSSATRSIPKATTASNAMPKVGNNGSQIIKTSPSATSSTLNAVKNAVPKVAAPTVVYVGPAVDVGVRYWQHSRLNQMHKEGRITEHQKNVAQVENVAGGVGGWACAVGGASGGAQTGAIIGSCFGPAGTAVGAGIGGFVGGIGGYLFGDKAASATVRAVMN